MPSLPPAALFELRRLVDDLAHSRWDTIQSDGRAGRLTAAELRRAVADYGRSLTPLPAEFPVDAYEIDGSPDSWAVDLPLWTTEEGQSDLTLQVTVQATDAGGVSLSVDDLHVL